MLYPRFQQFYDVFLIKVTIVLPADRKICVRRLDDTRGVKTLQDNTLAY